SSEEPEDEIRHLMHLRRLQQQKYYSYNPALDGLTIDSDSDNDYPAYTSRPRPRPRQAQRPVVPDMRFEQQFYQSVARLEEEGLSRTWVFVYAVLKDQLLVPFMSGLTWSLGAHFWLWYRT
ncbi:hypothetical protein BDF14DRAFT_1701827, partial [Spinellus fusiger]